MADGMRLAPQVRERLTNDAKRASVRGAYFRPVRKEPPDEVVSVGLAEIQHWIGQDGTRLRYDVRRALVVGVQFDGEDEEE